MAQASVATSALTGVLVVLGLLIIALRDSFWRSLEVKQAEAEPGKESPSPRRDLWILGVLIAAGTILVLFGRDGPIRTMRLGVLVILVLVLLVVERGRRRASGSDDQSPP